MSELSPKGTVDYRIMESRIRKIRVQGTNAKIIVFGGLPHGFGFSEGAAAEGWLVWDENLK